MPNKEPDLMTPETLVRQAQLLASSPEHVSSWLEQRAANRAREKIELHFDEPIERSLLARGDPLIDLSLAHFGAFASVVRPLFSRKGPEAKPLRVAALMNEILAKNEWLSGMPEALIKDDTPTLSPSPDTAVVAFLEGLEHEELFALFANPTINQSFLSDFLDRKAPWLGLDEKRRLTALIALSKNPRMDREYSGHMDGWAESAHDAIFDSAWMLSQNVPTTLTWASVMGGLYRSTKAYSFSIKEPLDLLARWRPDPADAELAKQEQRLEGYLGPYARQRQQLARLAVAAAFMPEAKQILASHEDVAVRAAYYAYADLSTEEIKAAYEKDELLAFNELASNKSAWRTAAQRQLLHDIAWDRKIDPDSHLIPQNTYQATLAHIRKMYPDWFKDEDYEQSVVAGAHAGAPDPLGSERLPGAELSQEIRTVLQKLLVRTAWLGWGIAAVLAVLLLTRR